MSTRQQRPVDSTYMSLLMSIVVLMFLEIPTAMAQADDYTKFGLSVGLFVTDRGSKTRIDPSGGFSGTDVDLERDLGLDTSDSVFRVDGYYRFAKKHRFDFSVFDLSRTASKLIQRDIEWNGTLFPVDTVVNSAIDLTIYKVAYTWAFLQRDSGYLGVTAGLYIADIGYAVSAPALGEREGAEVTAPLPVFGLRGEHHFTEKWSFRASGEVFVLEYGDFDGSLYDLYVGLDYQLFDRMAIGIGVNSVRMDIGITKENASGNLDWQYDGGLIFLKFDF